MINKKDTCPICQNEIDNPTKVVCPTCGTPHHRNCYSENGRCANDEFHAEGFIYEREPSVTYEAEGKSLTCKNCNHSLSDTALFCPNCATPVFANNQQPNQFGGQQQQPPFTPFGYQPVYRDPERKIDGVSAADIEAYTQKNSHYFISSFEHNRPMFNFAAFFLGPIYLFYRKEYLYGIILAILGTVTSLTYFLQNPSTIYPNINLSFLPEFYQIIMEVSSIGVVSLIIWIIGIAANFAPLFLANKLYKKRVISDIKAINAAGYPDENARKTAIYKKGGVSTFAAIACLVGLAIIYIAFFSGMIPAIYMSLSGGVVA